MKQKLNQKIGALAGVVAIAAAVVTPVVASAVTANTTINATIGSTISMTTGTTVAIGLTPGASPVVSSASDTVTVSTNKSNGYNLTLADSNATTTLVSGANSIAAHTGTYAAPSALGTNSWGYAVAGGAFDATYAAESSSTSSATKWAGVPATGAAQLIKTTAAPASGDTTTVWYGVKVDATKPTGVYTDTVTYTAVTN